MEHVSVGAISAVGVILFMAFARHYLRFDGPPYVTQRTFEALNRRFRVWEYMAIFPALLFMAGLGFAWYFLLVFIGQAHLRSLGPSEFLLAPGNEMWMIAAGFLGMLMVALPVHLLYGRLLGDDYDEYTLYINLKYRFDSWKAFRLFAYPMGLLCLTFILLGLDCYIRLTPQEIIVNRFLGFGETRYTYGQVRALEVAELFRAPAGNIVRRPHTVILFSDGFRLTTGDTIMDDQIDRDLPALRYVARQTRKPIRHVQFATSEKG